MYATKNNGTLYLHMRLPNFSCNSFQHQFFTHFASSVWFLPFDLPSFIFYNANVLAPLLSMASKAAVFPSSNVTHFSTCTRSSHTHNTHTHIQMHLESTGKTFRITSLVEFLGPGHLRFLLHVWPIKSALKWGKRGAMSEWHKGKRKKVPCCLPNTINI